MGLITISGQIIQIQLDIRMSEFCSENKEQINGSNYMENFETETRKSCLPNSGQGFPVSSISRSGLVSKGDIDTHLQALLTNANAIAPILIEPEKLEPTSTFANKAAALRRNIQIEYCFYYKRYIYILQDLLLTAATLASQRLPPDYVTKKENTSKINSKLNQILQVLQALVNSRNTTLRGYYGTETGVNMLNGKLDTTRAELIKHSEILKRSDLEKETKAAMIEYSLEKNSSSRNLLGIYVFMNIVAAGLIFYLYRGAEAQ